MASTIQRGVSSRETAPHANALVLAFGTTFLALGLFGCGSDEARPFGGDPLGQGNPTTAKPDGGGLVRGGPSQADGSTLSVSTPGETGGAMASGGAGGTTGTSGAGGRATGSGGAATTGGHEGTGGASATGGRVGSGGAPSSTGGSRAGTGGNPGSGGAAATTGGATGAAGTTAECRQYIVDYDSALQLARACKANGGGMSCGVAVTAKLAGCGSSCVTHVDDAGELEKIRKSWTKAECVDPACPTSVVCPPASGAGVCNVLTATCIDLP